MAQPTPIRSSKPTVPEHLGPPELALYHEIVRDYALAGNGPALRILVEALTSATIARECHEQIAQTSRIVWDGKGPNGEGIGKQKINPLCIVERDARSAFLVGMKMLNLELSKGALNRRQNW